jgi:hypothetical protein
MTQEEYSKVEKKSTTFDENKNFVWKDCIVNPLTGANRDSFYSSLFPTESGDVPLKW